jgi:hypothetical protein
MRRATVTEPLTQEALDGIRARARACACPAHTDGTLLLAEVDRLREHSATLNRVGWLTAEALGEIPDGATKIEGDALALTRRLIRKADDAGAARRNLLTSIGRQW